MREREAVREKGEDRGRRRGRGRKEWREGGRERREKEEGREERRREGEKEHWKWQVVHPCTLKLLSQWWLTCNTATFLVSGCAVDDV